MRLASVEKIVDIQPIEGADLIEKVQVLGWWIVTKKNEFKIGDLVSYIQIDTVVPEKEEFEFLRPRNFRVRTIKLKGCVSQGLIVPLPSGKFKEGDDLTDIFGVKKFTKDLPEEAPKPPKVWYKKYLWLLKQRVLFKLFPFLNKPTKSSFPTHLVSKTDEERIQNEKWILEKYKGKEFVIAEKLNGSSITLIYDKKKTKVCSRNQQILDKNDQFYKVFIETNFQEHLEKLVKHFKTNNVIVQGEFIGKPQGNYYKIEKNEIRLFNIIIDGKRIDQKTFYTITKVLNIPVCPLIDIKPLDFTLEEILKFAERKSTLNNKIEAEGLVFRSIEDNKSFKVISNKYLIKNEE